VGYIPGNPEEPGAESGLLPELGQTPVKAEENFLGNILGIVGVAGRREGPTVDLPVDAIHQETEGLVIATGGRADQPVEVGCLDRPSSTADAGWARQNPRSATSGRPLRLPPDVAL
jgi:hypothetical protein